jgi:uncharacterized damage-inducible protein DinB
MKAKDLFSHWTQIRASLLRGLDMLDDGQLAFVPREGLWSLGTVARHIAQAEEGWFRYVIERQYDEWPPEYTAADYPTVASIKTLLTEVHARTDAYLDTLSLEDLERHIEAPWGESLLLRWIIWVVVSHEAHHRGEIFLMLGLMGMQAPEM